MKFSKFFLILFSFIVFFGSFAVLAEESRYFSLRDLYTQTHTEYLTAKENYLNQGTLKTKEIFTQTLKEFLITRSNFLREYFLLLLKQGEGVMQEADLQDVRNQISWLDAEISQISSIATMEGLLTVATDFKGQYPNWEKSIFLFLTKLKVVQHQLIKENIVQLTRETKSKSEEGQEVNIEGLNWSEEVEKKAILANEKDILALETMDQLKVRRLGDAPKTWKKVNIYLGESEDSLKEALNLLDEVLKKEDLNE